jgi:hypothetical protein
MHRSVAQFEEPHRVLCAHHLLRIRLAIGSVGLNLFIARLGRYSHATRNLLGKAGRIRSEL